MSLQNCDRCGKIFNYDPVENIGNEKICPECAIEEKKDLKKVTEYLRKYPLANIMEVHEATGVSQAMLFRFIKSGSLKMRKPVEEFKCRICGNPIQKGTICDDCKSKIEKGFDADKLKKKKKKNKK